MTDFENFLVKNVDDWAKDVTEKIAEGVKYCLYDGGKRIRPNCFLQSYAMFANPDESAYYFALGIECYHNFTLVHDDLPCMDDDDMRRGKPSCHKVYGEGQAVLIGDALQNLAYTYILKAISLAESKDRAIRAATLFNSLVGGEGLIGGQSVDIDENTVIDENTLKFIYKHKTCDLIEASIVCGAVMAGADEKNVKLLSDFAYYYGCVFQLTDDILDKDKNEKNTVMALKSEKEARQLVDDLVTAAKDTLLFVKSDVKYFISLLENTVNRKK